MSHLHSYLISITPYIYHLLFTSLIILIMELIWPWIIIYSFSIYYNANEQASGVFMVCISPMLYRPFPVKNLLRPEPSPFSVRRIGPDHFIIGPKNYPQTSTWAFKQHTSPAQCDPDQVGFGLASSRAPLRSAQQLARTLHLNHSKNNVPMAYTAIFLPDHNWDPHWIYHM